MVGASRFFLLLSTPFSVPLLRHRPHSLLQITPRNCHNLRKLLPQQLTAISLSSSSNFNHRYCLCISTSSSSIFPIGAYQQFHCQTSFLGDDLVTEGSAFDNHSLSSSPHPWAEWSTFVENLSTSGYFHRASNGSVEDELLASELQNEFVRSAYACLAFARERPNLLRLLCKRDIEVLVESGKPLLFKNADGSVRKMQLFINSGGTNDLDADKAQTVDLMRYILSYVSSKVKSSENNVYKWEIVESSARKLLGELSKLGFSAPNSNIGSVNQSPYRNGQTASLLGQKVEMKRGDWICTRCSFMNFARNVKCLECEEARPKRQLTGGEWECPQCDFYNYGRNTVCLRCDCNRPGKISVDPHKTISGIEYGGNENKANVDERLAANEEKAQRWFSKISQMDSSSDMDKAMADEDFPEIMPLRKGVNRFVISTKKTPLEKRSANPQFRQNLGNDGFLENNNDHPDGKDNSLDATISVKLDEILGKSRSLPNIGMNSSHSVSQQQSRVTNPNYVPFVPLPPDMFAKKPNSSTAEIELSAMDHPQADKSTETESFTPRENSQSQDKSINKAIEEGEKSEKWFKRVEELLHNETDLANGISDDDFPEIMPLLNRENRFVVSKKKDRSFTSPSDERRAAMEQTGNTSAFVPFVPFPADYFAKKDKPSQEMSTSDEPEKARDQAINVGEKVQTIDSQKNWSRNELDQTLLNPQSRRKDVLKNKNRPEENQRSSFSSSKSPPSGLPEIREQWSGKSLEGSAVKEPDPLDMSEEAKAERWFRRVAQIKDISELSQIPDEDFPSIMPMRKGVNRFVVSKRKTPLERRLTSPQYRRNLPVVSSDPLKRENDGS